MVFELPSFLDAEDILEEEPRLSFFGQQNRFGQSPAQRQFFRGQFQNFFNRYLGTLGQQLEQGNTPTGTFTDFLRDVNFGSEFAAIPPSLRGGGTRRFAPPVRFQGF